MYILKKISKLVFKSAGWKVTGEAPPHPRKFVIIGAPHTTDWDVVFGLGGTESIGLETRFLVTHKAFKGIQGMLLRSFGAIAVNKDANQGMVQTAVKMFKENKEFTMIIALEGTKYKTNKLRTGFYHIARQANVPILMANLNYLEKKIELSPLYDLTGNMEDDFRFIWNYFRERNHPRFPERGIQGELDFEDKPPIYR